MITDVAYILNPMFKEKFSLCIIISLIFCFLSLLTNNKCPLELNKLHTLSFHISVTNIIQAYPYLRRAERVTEETPLCSSSLREGNVAS